MGKRKNHPGPVPVAAPPVAVPDDPDAGVSPVVDERMLRFARYSGIISPERLIDAIAVVVGVGAVGRQVALMLASMGVGHIVLVDHDTVSPENMGSQGYPPAEVGDHKVDALARSLGRANPDAVIVPVRGVFVGDALPPAGTGGVRAVFCCVDSMEARMEVFRAAVGGGADLMIEGRMGAESWMVHAFEVKDTEACRAWERSWYPSHEALQEPCSQRSTIYNSTMNACVIVAQFARYLGDRPLSYRSYMVLSCGLYTTASARDVIRWCDESDPRVVEDGPDQGTGAVSLPSQGDLVA